MSQQTLNPEIVKENCKSQKTKGNCWLAFFIIGIVYILSPIDILPDFIPIVGWLDDIGIGGGLLGLSFQQLLKKYIK